MLKACPSEPVQTEEFSTADLLKLARSFPERSRARVLSLIETSSDPDDFRKLIYLEVPDLFFAELLSMNDDDLDISLIQSLAQNLISLFESFPEEADRIDLLVCNVFKDLMGQDKHNIARQLALALNHKLPLDFSDTSFKVRSLFPLREVV